jgi:hypothetical protein
MYIHYSYCMQYSHHPGLGSSSFGHAASPDSFAIVHAARASLCRCNVLDPLFRSIRSTRFITYVFFFMAGMHYDTCVAAVCWSLEVDDRSWATESPGWDDHPMRAPAATSCGNFLYLEQAQACAHIQRRHSSALQTKRAQTTYLGRFMMAWTLKLSPSQLF